jgi:protein-disulfide isomerase
VSGKKAREERREQRLHEEGEVERQERRQRLLKLGAAASFLAIVAVAVAVVVSQNQGGGGGGSLEDVGLVRKQLAGIPQNQMVLGEPSAKVKLVEFGDLQCSACKAYSEGIIPEVIDSKVRSGKAKIEFRNFRIIGEDSVPAGAAAIAAGKQGHGWSFLELFYRNQGTENGGYVTDSFLTDVAKGAGVPDIARWDADRKSKAVLDQVASTTAETQRFGFSGTPSFAVEGPASNGLEPLGTAGTSSAAALEGAIDGAG